MIAAAREDTEIFPMVNNYDPLKQIWQPKVGEFLSSPDARATFVKQVDTFLAANPSLSGTVAGL